MNTVVLSHAAQSRAKFAIKSYTISVSNHALMRNRTKLGLSARKLLVT